MGQKSNTSSLRPHLKQINLSNNNIKLNFLKIFIVQQLKFLLQNKGINIFKVNLGFVQNKINIYFYVFYNTQKILKYKRYKYVSYLSKYIKISAILTKIFKLLNNSILEVKIININKQVEKGLVKQVYLLFKKYLNTLFDKRFYLCIDITKVSTLFILNKVDTKLFLEYLTRVFSSIHKKNHLRYLKLLLTLFNFIILKSKNKILGLKLIINGKLRGKAIASQHSIICGIIPTQTINKNIEFEKLHVFTVYGVFGFSLWVHKI